MRLKLIIMNIIYVVVSGVCLFFLLTRPFINIGMGYTISRETFKTVAGDTLGIDTNEIIDEKGIKLDIRVNLSSKVCFETALQNNPYPYVKENILDKNLDNIAATIREPLAKLDRIATTKALSVQMKISIYTDIATINPSANAAELATSAGITDEYLDGISTSFIDDLNGESAVFSTIMSSIYDAFDSMYDELAKKDASFASTNVTSEKRNSLDKDIAEPLEYLGWIDEDSTILGEDESLCVLLAKVLNLDNKEQAHSGDAEPLLAPRFNAEQQDTSHFAQLVKELIYANIDEVGSTIGLVFRIIGFVHIFIVAAWGILALFCILKSLFKNPGIFFGLIYWLNLIIQIVLGIVFVFVVPLLRNVVGMIPLIGATIAEFIKPFTISIASSTTIPAFCTLGIFITSFFYRHWKRKRKDEI